MSLMKGKFLNLGFFLSAAIFSIIVFIKGFSFGMTLDADFILELYKDQLKVEREYDDLIRIEQEWVNETAEKLETEKEQERDRESNTIVFD